MDISMDAFMQSLADLQNRNPGAEFTLVTSPDVTIDGQKNVMSIYGVEVQIDEDLAGGHWYMKAEQPKYELTYGESD